MKRNPKTLWARFWERAPRQLRFRKEGKVILAISLAVGFAAINTGNNLLFIGWGAILSTIILSGIMSEATLKYLAVQCMPPPLSRVDENTAIKLKIKNSAKRLSAYAVGCNVFVNHQQKVTKLDGPLSLLLAAQSTQEGSGQMKPKERGFHQISLITTKTSYPFGLFEKSRRFPCANEVGFWVAPKKFSLHIPQEAMLATRGQQSAAKEGFGEDFFSLRWLREGEDARKVHWRLSARYGRPLVRVHEAVAGTQIFLIWDIAPQKSTRKAEELFAIFSSLAEKLLEHHYLVGVAAPSVFLPPAGGEKQRLQILRSLAQSPLDTAVKVAQIPATAIALRCGLHNNAGHSSIDLRTLVRAKEMAS